jgi:NitT/TauT family transport system ATP-binding protein
MKTNKEKEEKKEKREGRAKRERFKIAFKGVSKAFKTRDRRTSALENIDLQVREGEFLCVVGPSGCGKTTLLNLVAGFDFPDSGEVFYDGERVTGASPSRIMIFQEPTLFPWLNVYENVEFGLKNVPGASKQERRERVAKLIETVHLSKFGKAYSSELSGGMKQRVAIARALAPNPDVLLMDEPFAALDAQTRDILHKELQDIWVKTRKTIVFVTHNVREAVCLGDRVVLLSFRPGTVKKEIRVKLKRPRYIEDESVIRLARQIKADLKIEVDKALHAELKTS